MFRGSVDARCGRMNTRTQSPTQAISHWNREAHPESSNGKALFSPLAAGAKRRRHAAALCQPEEEPWGGGHRPRGVWELPRPPPASLRPEAGRGMGRA